MFLDGYDGQRVYVIPSKKLVIVRIGSGQRNDWTIPLCRTSCSAA
jgi:hypothetical protein